MQEAPPPDGDGDGDGRARTWPPSERPASCEAQPDSEAQPDTTAAAPSDSTSVATVMSSESAYPSPKSRFWKLMK